MKILILSLITFSVMANDQVAQCGAEPGFFQDLFTNAKHVREICLETLRKENEKKKYEELAEIQTGMKAIDKRLKEVAYKYNYPNIHCEASASQRPNEERTKECRALIRSKSALIDRMNYLMGWDSKPKQVEKGKEPAPSQLDCPSKSELEKIKPVRYFNKKLYQTWERCVVLKADEFY